MPRGIPKTETTVTPLHSEPMIRLSDVPRIVAWAINNLQQGNEMILSTGLTRVGRPRGRRSLKTIQGGKVAQVA